jgi:tetratricopeptide (TPR) repeat protein
MVETSTPIEIFCSYAHEDESWLRKLETHLSLLKRQGLISLWYDRLIVPGTDWAHTIDMHLETASVILLLVSADFFASDYCYGIEMQRALERQEAGEARVLPILVRPVEGWQQAPFAHLQALPTDARPLAVWRNKDTALADVAAGIRRVIVEELPQLSASAPRVALPAIWNIPYPRNPFFLGRDDELALVRHRLQTGQATALSQAQAISGWGGILSTAPHHKLIYDSQAQAISGLGGIGKTQLALEYAYRYHQDYQAVLWARAESIEALVSSYVALATLLQLPEHKAREQYAIVQAVKTWLQTHHDWLLILDNADELALLSDFLPPSLGGHLLLTTRAAATGGLAYRLEIETLLPEQGALFLLRRAALIAPDTELLQASPQERELAVQISQELGGLPLALDQAGAYLEETGTDLASYWLIYQRHRADLLRRRGGLVADHPAPVAITWSLSFQRVEEKNPAAADLLRLCAYLAPDAIPEEILTVGASFLGPVLGTAAADAFLLNQAIEIVRSYSLLQRNPHRKMFSMHRLVQAVLRDELQEATRRLWAERAVLALSAVFPDSTPDLFPQCERLLPHVLLAAQFIETYQISRLEAGLLLGPAGSYLMDRGSYQEAEPLMQSSLHIIERALGPEHHAVAGPLQNLAGLYLEQGKYEQAEQFYLHAWYVMDHQSRSLLPLIFPLWGDMFQSLGSLYLEWGKYEKAKFYLREAQHYVEALDSDHDQIGALALNLFGIKQDKYANARSKALVFNALGILYLEQGKYAEAKPLFQQAVDIWDHTFPEHPNVAGPLNQLANLYLKQGKLARAEQFYLRSLHTWEHALGSAHHYVASPLNGLANLYSEQGKYAEAEPLFQRALHIQEQALGPDHPKTGEIIHSFARFREAQGNSKEARTLYARALAVREQALGAHHPKTIETRKCLIALLHTMGQHEEAAKLEATQAES